MIKGSWARTRGAALSKSPVWTDDSNLLILALAHFTETNRPESFLLELCVPFTLGRSVWDATVPSALFSISWLLCLDRMGFVRSSAM